MVKSRATVFILPMIVGVPHRTYAGYQNVFIGMSGHEGFDDLSLEQRRIYVVFRVEDLEETYYKSNKIVVNNEERLNVFRKHKQYVTEHRFGNYIAFEFYPLDNFIDDFDRFELGQYSKFSSKYKRAIKQMYTDDKIKNIINPTEKERLKKAKELKAVLPPGSEVFAKPNKLEEEFSPAKFIELN